MPSRSPAPQSPPLLAIQAVGKDYTATVLDGVNVELFAGEVLALTGENGAGKSTLSKILCGLEQPTRGGMQLAGQAYAPTSRRDAERHGVRMVMQELGLVPTLTVAENLLMGRLPHRLGWLQRDALHTAARAQLAKIGLDSIDPATPMAKGWPAVRAAPAIRSTCDSRAAPPSAACNSGPAPIAAAKSRPP